MEQTSTAKDKPLKKILIISLIFFFLSFLGWCIETIYCIIISKGFLDRGFLTLPFCVIYGFPPCLVYILIGTPKLGIVQKILKSISNSYLKNIIKYSLYFILSALIATIFELVFGFIFKKLGIRLWDYTDYPLNYNGYICLEFTILWGVLITVFMSLFWDKIYILFSKITLKNLLIINIVLWILIISDFTFNIIYLIIEKKHFRIIK